MPQFACRIGAPDGSVLDQRRLAVSAEALRRELEDEGFHIFSISGAQGRLRLPLVLKKDKVRSQDFLLFNTQLKTLLRAGLPLAQSLELLKTQQPDPAFGALLGKVHQQVTTGVALSDAFLSLGDTFPALYANSLRAGERSGDLEFVLDGFVQYQRLVEQVRKKIIGALTYPAVLVMLAIGLVVILMTYVIPEFSKMFTSFTADLPLPTVIVMRAAKFMQSNWLVLLIAAIGGFIIFKWWASNPRGRRIVDRWKLRVPVLGNLLHLFAMTQFSRSLGVLLAGGTPMVPAVETAAASISNTHISELFLGCVVQVQEGRALSEAMEDTGQAPDLALAMIRVGEATGALPEMLAHTSEFFDEEIEFLLARIVTLFEPAILVFMGLIVAGLLLAVYYPLLTMVSRIG
ncbi:MAG: type II secretion system F family protein [bacterium]|nr:type II secretion system F family protein [bacterium]